MTCNQWLEFIGGSNPNSLLATTRLNFLYSDGQKRPVFIYRFLTAGTIDEKIYQRQVTKLGLSNCKLSIFAQELEVDFVCSQHSWDL